MAGEGAHGSGAAATLDAIAATPRGRECVRHLTTIEARAARYDTLEEPLHPGVLERLRSKSIDALFTHQVAAIDRLSAGESVVVATGTASGKSLCYQIPIAQAALSAEPATALMLFPTKALAQDQLRSLRSWLIPGMKAVTYDGDTPDSDRGWARKNATVVLTNPEMLHMGILPSHQRWATFLMRLQIVVVDELHTFRGIFGSHVAHLLRRLRRICAHYGSDPVFCFTSATIGNPGALASALCGLVVVTVDDDGAPRGERRLALWERPLVDGANGSRPSANLACADLLSEFVAAGHQTLAFTRSRKGAELVAQYARRILTENDAPELADRVAPYRAGYLAEERRALEQRLTRRELLGVAATNALELGIDVGGLDAVVLNGFPGTLASMWQQMGRAGRTGLPAAGVLVAGDDQLDQWYLRHPTELVDRRHEDVVVNPDNPFVARAQLACATHELPLTSDDSAYFGDVLDEVVAALVRDDLAKPRAGKLYWAGREPPAPSVGLRTGTNQEFRLIDRDLGEVVGTVDASRAHSVAHEGAIYLHLGRQYRVEQLVEQDRVAFVRPADDLDEYTQPRSDIDITITGVEQQADVGAGVAHLGSVEVTSRVTGYQRKHISNGRVIETVGLDLAPQTLPTRACWYTVPLGALLGPESQSLHSESPQSKTAQSDTARSSIVRSSIVRSSIVRSDTARSSIARSETGPLDSPGVEPAQVLGAVHAAEHGLIGLLPLFTICDRWDVGGVSMAAHPQTGEPTIFVYDGYPGGAGIAELAFAARRPHVAATLDLVQACRCDDGCPSCVQSPKCGNWNEYLDKTAAIVLLSRLVGSP